MGAMLLITIGEQSIAPTGRSYTGPASAGSQCRSAAIE